MPTDIVDDLEHAEDMLRSALDALEHCATSLHAFHGNRHPLEECPKEACVAARKALAELEDYQRPTVDDEVEDTDEDDGAG